MKQRRFALLFILIFSLLLAACDGGSGNAPDNEPRNNGADGNALEPSNNENLGADNETMNDGNDAMNEGNGSDEEDPFPDTAAPPPAILLIGEQEQESGIGTYCWQDPANDTAICADMIGIPSPRSPLVVESPLTAQLEFAIVDAPNELQLDVFPLTEDMASSFSDETTIWWEVFDAERQNYILPLTNNATQELTLEPGQYLFAVFARWDGYGDVTYGFLVEVVGDEAESDTDSTAGDDRLTAAGYLQQSIEGRDYDALRQMMSDPFAIALFASEGTSYAPADAIAALQETYLLPDNTITFGAAPDMSGLVPDGDVSNVWSPEQPVREIVFSQGWGPDGTGEAFLFLVEGDDGGVHWDGLLYAPAGFAAME